MINTKKYIEKEIVDLNENCSEPECSSRYNKGIKIKRINKIYFLNIPIQTRLRSCNIYCPKHRKSCKDEIYNSIHEQANQIWKNRKRDRQYNEYNKILDSNLFPQFKVNQDSHNNVVNGPINKRLKLSFNDMTMGEYIKQVNIDVPIMYIKENEIQIINSKGIILETITREDADYQNFKNKYDKVEYDKKDFFAIKTNNLTGLKVTRVHDLTNHVEDVISMNEFSRLKGPIYSVFCPATNNIYDSMHITGIHRVKLDNEEKLLPYNKYKDNKIMGELNNNLIIKEKYDF